MSAQLIDVLAVLDDAIARYEWIAEIDVFTGSDAAASGLRRRMKLLREARAAVAELIRRNAELEAAMRQSGEAMAWQRRTSFDGKKWTDWTKHDGVDFPATTRVPVEGTTDQPAVVEYRPLYTAPPATSGLVEALRAAHRHIDMDALRVSHCKDAALIDAALAAHHARDAAAQSAGS